MMRYGNYDVQQDGMDNKAHEEWLLQGESGIAMCGIIGLLKGCQRDACTVQADFYILALVTA